MVTLTLNELLKQKEQYAAQWPGGQATMSRGAFSAYHNLLREIRAAAKRSQGVLPGMNMESVPPRSGQSAMLLGEGE